MSWLWGTYEVWRSPIKSKRVATSALRRVETAGTETSHCSGNICTLASISSDFVLRKLLILTWAICQLRQELCLTRAGGHLLRFSLSPKPVTCHNTYSNCFAFSLKKCPNSHSGLLLQYQCNWKEPNWLSKQLSYDGPHYIPKHHYLKLWEGRIKITYIKVQTEQAESSWLGAKLLSKVLFLFPPFVALSSSFHHNHFFQTKQKNIVWVDFSCQGIVDSPTGVREQKNWIVAGLQGI